MKLSWIMLTATVNVHPGAAVAIVDPTLRLSQYQDALARWLDLANRDGFRVMLVENSGADLRAIKIALPFTARARLEILSVGLPSEDVMRRGKGASEGVMIDEAVRAIDAQSTEWIAKGTGRLFVKNLSSALPRRGRDLSLIMRGTISGCSVDSRLLIARRAIWGTTFKDMANEVDDPEGLFIEHVIARRVIDAERSKALTVGRFRRAPQFEGFSGTSGQRYERKTALKRLLSSPIDHMLGLIPRQKQF
jgi:hypothetical protein